MMLLSQTYRIWGFFGHHLKQCVCVCLDQVDGIAFQFEQSCVLHSRQASEQPVKRAFNVRRAKSFSQLFYRVIKAICKIDRDVVIKQASGCVNSLYFWTTLFVHTII